MGSSPAEQDFGEECREAFLNHCLELAKIDLTEPTQRLVNASRRIALLRQIDTVLDTFNEWREMTGVSAQFYRGPA